MKKLGNYYVTVGDKKLKLREVVGNNFNVDSILKFDKTDSFYIKYNKNADEDFNVRMIFPTGLRLQNDEGESLIVDDLERRFNLVTQLDTFHLLNLEIKESGDLGYANTEISSGGFNIQRIDLGDIILMIVIKEDELRHLIVIPNVKHLDASIPPYIKQQGYENPFISHIKVDNNSNFYVQFKHEVISLNLNTRYDLNSIMIE